MRVTVSADGGPALRMRVKALIVGNVAGFTGASRCCPMRGLTTACWMPSC